MVCTAAVETIVVLRRLSLGALSCCMACAERNLVMPVKPQLGGATLQNPPMQQDLGTCLTSIAHCLERTDSSVSGRVPDNQTNVPRLQMRAIGAYPFAQGQIGSTRPCGNCISLTCSSVACQQKTVSFTFS